MSKVVYYTAMTLDGFIATAEHSLDWLLSRANDPRGPLGFEKFDARVGAMIMGRRTYDYLVEGPLRDAGEWPHRQPCWVLTSRPGDPRRFARDGLRFTSAPAEQVVTEARSAAGELDVWCVGGGRTAAWLHAAGLLAEVHVSIAPVMIGTGVPVLGSSAELELLEVDRNGEFAACRYRVVRGGSAS